MLRRPHRALRACRVTATRNPLGSQAAPTNRTRPSCRAVRNFPPSNQLAEIADDFGLDMSLDDLTNQREAVRGAIASLRHIDDMPEERPAVAYPRTSGYRPHPDENPYNAWYWRTEVKGADSGPLAGEEIGVKDVVSLAGVPMMNGSRALEGYVPTIDATIVTRLLDAGATIVGKTACADFSFSGGGHTSGYGPVRNPRKPTHAPGGSSKGSAAALAAGDVTMAIGGDQGGSIRIPASWCGVVGLKGDLRPDSLHRLPRDRDDPRSHRPDDRYRREHGPHALGSRRARPARSAPAGRDPRRLRAGLHAGDRRGLRRRADRRAGRRLRPDRADLARIRPAGERADGGRCGARHGAPAGGTGRRDDRGLGARAQPRAQNLVRDRGRGCDRVHAEERRRRHRLVRLLRHPVPRARVARREDPAERLSSSP